jgi:hypothetical protein
MTAAVCVTWSVSERVSECDSVPREWGRWAREGQAQTGVPGPWAVKTSVFFFFFFLLKKDRKININL